MRERAVSGRSPAPRAVARGAVALVAVALLTMSPSSRAARPARARPVAAAPEQGPEATPAASADDVARVLAGLPPSPGSPLAALAARPAVAAHARAMEAAWTKHTAPTLAALRRFATAELADGGAAPVFYPFGGPDILNAVGLFPEASTYTLLGLEPVGLLPSTALFADPKVLGAVQRALFYVLRFNHFITDSMADQLKGRVGVAALLGFFLVRTGHAIVDARLVMLGDDGGVVDDDAEARERVRGVEFTVRRGASERTQVVRYFAGNINDQFFSRAPGLVPHLLGQGQVTTVLKAASYLMYYPAFDDVRAVVLARSGLLVTDTSGLPFHRLDTPQWQLTLYGTYKAPIADYADRCQPSLQTALAKRGKGPLPFSYGYAYPGHNHLVVARRAADRALEDPVFDGVKTRGENTLCVEGRERIERTR